MSCYGFKSPGNRFKIPDCSLTLFRRSIRSGTLESVLCDPTIISFFFARVKATLILCQSPSSEEAELLGFSRDLTKDTNMQSLSLPYKM
jgi:hypothetical protein